MNNLYIILSSIEIDSSNKGFYWNMCLYFTKYFINALCPPVSSRLIGFCYTCQPWQQIQSLPVFVNKSKYSRIGSSSRPIWSRPSTIYGHFQVSGRSRRGKTEPFIIEVNSQYQYPKTQRFIEQSTKKIRRTDAKYASIIMQKKYLQIGNSPNCSKVK